MTELGRLIATARARRGYTTQQAFADALGKTPTFVSRLERGAAKEMPSPEDVRLIARVVGLPVARLLEAAGYLDPAAPTGDVRTVPGDDPRAVVLDLLDGLTDQQVAGIVNALRPILAIAGIRDNPSSLPKHHTNAETA
ncbi:MAG TPA: helix-turn-helix transcriptional regulator [Thermomicrobiales bacterium]|nr:helix-turn-helix transcriptional regulator [Thermomicrobiales bacterium]